MNLNFLGGAGTVTGSKYLLNTGNKKILIDCGMFQGLKKLRQLNWEEFPVDPSEIDYILLTHAHLDHTGYLPRILKQGFHGKIIATEPTLEIAEIILRDSAKIHEEDAEFANRKGFSKHSPALPFFDIEDVEKTIKLFSSETEGEWLNIDDNVKARFNYVGHILGACFIEIKINEKILVFSGDIGRKNDLLLNPPKSPENADVIVMESTYGDRFHPKDPENKLADIITQSIRKKGTVLIPSFAVERSQALMYLLCKLESEGKIPTVPMYIDSPMASETLEVFLKNMSWHKLSSEEFHKLYTRFGFVKSVKDTFRVIENKQPKIIIAGGGMAAGGRVLRYMEHYLEDSQATVLIVGFQAEGTRGRDLLEGAKEIKIAGKYYSVRAKINQIEGLSAHADQNGLVEWLSHLKKSPEKIFIVHGESEASNVLSLKIKEKYGWDCTIPVLNDSFEF